MEIVYTISRCRKNNALYGSMHCAEDDRKTLCGLKIDGNWCITGHAINQTLKEITCQKCKRLMEKR